MRKQVKNYFATLVSVLLVCGALTSAFAANSYKTEEGSIPAEAGERFANKGGILAQDDGSLDAFTMVSEDQKPKTLHHHRSTDGGKTWQALNDTAWLAECAKKYDIPAKENRRPHYFNPDSIVTDGKGVFYFTAATREKEFDDGKNSGTMDVSGLFRLSKGQVTLVKEYDQRMMEMPRILAYSAGGVALYNPIRGGGELNQYRFMVVNPSDGAVKYEHVFDGMIPAQYADGKVSGWNQYTIVEEEGKQTELVGREVDKRLWIVFDTAAGKEIQKVVNPLDHMDKAYTDDFELFFHAAGPDGMYFAGVEGLYRLKPGAQSFEKLMDGAAAGFAGTRACDQFFAGRNGEFYALTIYLNRKNAEDPQNYKQTKLLRFIPA